MLAFMTIGVSCSENDASGDGNGGGNENTGSIISPEAIVGTWKCVASEGYDSSGEWNETYDDSNEYWGFIFNADGTGLDFEYDNGETDGFDIEWLLSDNKLTITFYDFGSYEEDEYVVEKLTSSELIIAEYWESEDGSDKEMEKYIFKKIANLEFDNNNNDSGSNDDDQDEDGNEDDDDKEDLIQTVPIVGTWKCVASEGYDSSGEWNETYDDSNEYWGFIFNADGTGLDFEYDNGETDGFDIEWLLSDNKLTITFYDFGSYEEDEYVVEKLTSSELIIVEYWESEDGSDKEMEKYTLARVE